MWGRKKLCVCDQVCFLVHCPASCVLCMLVARVRSSGSFTNLYVGKTFPHQPDWPIISYDRTSNQILFDYWHFSIIYVVFCSVSSWSSGQIKRLMVGGMCCCNYVARFVAFDYGNVCISIVIIGLRPKLYGALLFYLEWCASVLDYYIVQGYNFGAL